ncbi:MAG TPA: glycoside hydrolase, partial [Candidatus Hydrogenedentes bacterium]|nr:glycoside hydrolase [Candidatus Hydrogenedentota bacterium]
RNALPTSCRLFINEYNVVEPDDLSVRAKYHQLIDDLLAKGAPVEGIGFQGHFHEPPESVEDALSVFNTFAGLGLPIVVTEFDVNTKDEAKQAAFTRDFMTAAFSHPACSGFVFWGFWEGSHWRPDGAMFRQDWSEKLNLAVYRDLVFKEWWTGVKGRTNNNGEFYVRGFKGSYRIIVGDDEKFTTIGDNPTTVDILQ